MSAFEEGIEAALRPFGWTCGPEFWHRYDTDAWVFNLVNIVDALSIRMIAFPKWDSERDQDEECACGHTYYRHFDSYDDMRPVGCKYCDCAIFASLDKGGQRIAAIIEREADKYWSNSCGMTDESGEKYDEGWVAGMKRAAEIARREDKR